LLSQYELMLYPEAVQGGLINDVLQIVHTYKHKHANTNTDCLDDVSPSPLLDDTTRSGEH